VDRGPNDLGLAGLSSMLVLLSRESCLAVDPRWTAHSALGPIRPTWVKEKTAHAFTAFSDRRAGWTGSYSLARPILRLKILSFGTGSFSVLGQNGLSLFHLNLCFSIFRKSRIISKMTKN
jgi:hypothetical protein